MPAPVERILFFAASSLADKDEQQTLLDLSCKDNPELRRKIDRLLSIQSEAADYFESPPEVPDEGNVAEAGEGLGGRIGRYRLMERIGAGGFGVVYLAEQFEPVRRKVALKIVRLGMDTEHVIARFEQERQALALMDHPNIARVLDAGATASGRPYFVMELVDGDKITDFCDANRLGIRQRLKVFAQICQAVQHAHLKGVIHRDLKPSNILVRKHDGVVMPKVIDFGIAKAATATADDDATLTAQGQFIGTPAYMSPEMAAGGLDVDTRTDIHSLGSVLYELLTGRPPYDPKRLRGLGMDEIRRILREEDPQRPSALLASMGAEELAQVADHRGVDPAKLVSLVKGDLDWIVMRAMERDRERRYQTANGLAIEVDRYLRHEPVAAGPPDRLYRLAKLVRRNRVPFLFGGTVVVLLAAGFGTSTQLFLREKKARAEQERLKLQADMARENESKLREIAELRGQVAQAAVLISYENIEDADRLLAQVPVELAPPSLETAQTYSKVGDWHVMAGRWKEAADRYAASALALISVDQSNTEAISLAFFPAASTLAQEGNRKLYDRIREIAIDRFAKTSHPVIAEQVVKLSLLLPAEPETLSSLMPLAGFIERSVNEGHEGLMKSDYKTKNDYKISWCCFSVALMKFREGDYAAASDWAERSLSLNEDYLPREASIRSLMAMIAWRQGRKEDARAELAMAKTPIEDVFSKPVDSGAYGRYWFDWVDARVFYYEALSMIEG